MTSPEALRALADRIESRECTGLAASWCPVHGDCTCPDDERADVGLCFPTCPLHGFASSHAAGEPRELIVHPTSKGATSV